MVYDSLNASIESTGLVIPSNVESRWQLLQMLYSLEYCLKLHFSKLCVNKESEFRKKNCRLLRQRGIVFMMKRLPWEPSWPEPVGIFWPMKIRAE